MDFEAKFKTLLSFLKKNNNVAQVSSNFSNVKSLVSMFSYLSKLESIENILNVKLSRMCKSEERATTFRNEGNVFYKRKKLDRALEYYNKTIINAPHPELKPGTYKKTVKNSKNSILSMIENNYDIDDKEFKSLSLGLANRSAVLYELKQYDKCILDCELSLLFGYPKILSSKLCERKAKCYLSLNQIEMARTTLEDGINDLSMLGLESNKIASTKKTLEDLLAQCLLTENVHFNVKSDNKTSLYTQKNIPLNYLFDFNTSIPPTPSQVSEKIPSMSSAIEVCFTPDRGRYLVATRDIDPGEVLITERSYSSIVLFEYMDHHCSSCLSRTLTPVPCPMCCKTVFCSEKCREEGMRLFHSVECELLTCLEELDLGKNAQLVIRLVIETTFSKLKEFVPEFEKQLASADIKDLSYNHDGVYDSQDYRTIYSLVTNKNSRTVPDLFKRTAIAYVLVKLLLEGRRFFYNDDGKYVEPTEDELALVGTVIINHLMHVSCNAHSITEFGANLTNMQDSILYDIGAGAFAVLSLCNHSCNPSGARTSYGRVEVFRAITNVEAGAEITDSYGKHFAMQDLKGRQSILQSQYYFQCTCDACLYNWPVYESLSEEFKVKCVRCSGVILPDNKKCSKCDTSYDCGVINDKNLVFDYSAFWKKLTDYNTEYHEVYKFVLLGDSSIESITFLENYLKLFKHIQLPHKLYFEAQETLKHCYDKCGAYFYDC